jgi:hypothetical protein
MGILKSITRKIGKLVGAEDPQDKAARNAAKAAATNASMEAQSQSNRKFAAQQDAATKQLTRRQAKRTRGRDATIITSGTDIQSRSLLG